VSVDFTEGRLATRNDLRNPWTGRNMLPLFIELNNRVMERFSAEERVRIGVHTCPGGDRDSVHSADVPYSDLLPSMFGINAGYFLIQLASERDKDPVYQLIGEQLGSTDDCGFSPFSIDEKPSHGSPDFARDTAWQKISNRVEGTRLAAEKLGIG
jgi:hypothetical protein